MSWSSQHRRLTNENAEDPTSAGEIADRCALLFAQPARDEVAEFHSVRRQHAHGTVLSAGQLDGEIDDALKQSGKGQVGRQRQPGVEEALGAAAAESHRGRIIAPLNSIHDRRDPFSAAVP